MNIEVKTLWQGRTGNDKTYFIPRLERFSDTAGERLIMSFQEITGSDYFHPVHYVMSDDMGYNWTIPELMPDMGRKDIGRGIQEGVCDVVPDYHLKTNKLIAMGHNVYYQDGHLFDSMGDFNKAVVDQRLQRFPVYNVRNEDGEWLESRKKLQVDEFDQSSIYTCGSSQKVFLEDGNVLIPFTYGVFDRRDRMVTSILFGFDGQDFTVIKKGNVLELPAGRGLLEPSMICYQGTYYITIRAEDGHGHVAVSDDGLQWQEMKNWSFDNEIDLEMSTTQQHWLHHRDKLYLVYTRKTEYNTNVMRWRSPLFICEVDIGNLCLKRETEQTVFPLIGDGVNEGHLVPMMGNFNTKRISDEESIITVGEMVPRAGFIGNTLLARLR